MESKNEVKTTKGNPKVKPPRLRYIDSEHLPEEVHGVMKDIQKWMMDDIAERDGSPRKTVPNMPRDFICSEVTSVEKEKMIKLAGKGHDKCLCSQITIPFFMYPVAVPTADPRCRWFVWSGNVISFSKVSDVDSQFAVVTVEGSLLPVKDKSTGERNPTFIPISSDMKELTSKPLRKFLESPLVVNHTNGHRLVSSYKMTISWLRSRLDKALNKYKEMKKDVEVIPTIKQKEGGPLLLHVEVEKEDSGKLTKHDFLFNICPAFRVSPCWLAIPVVSHLESDLPTEFGGKENEAKHYMWKIIPKCSAVSDDAHVKHKPPNITTEVRVQQLLGIQIKEKPKKPTANDKSLYKESIAKPRPITPDVQKQCQECVNPVSRMLLEYYYQYGYIPEEDMSQANSFVTGILEFFEESIKEDRKDNDPRIIAFVKSGSVAEKLKVIKPDEFDVMIQIDFPKSTKCYTFKSHDTFPTGYAICQVKRSHTFSRGLQRCFRKSDEFGYCLAPEQLAFGWLYGKLQRAINKYKVAFPDGADLKLRPSGPALLLEITPSSDHSNIPRVISVDLVLALKLSESDGRYAVAKRAKEEQFYQKVITNQQSSAGKEGQLESEAKLPAEVTKTTEERESGGDVKEVPNIVDEKKTTEETEFARKNLKFLWRISYSPQEKQYLEYIEEQQRENGVQGCQNICLMILKTVCTREILKREDESVLYREVSSYILKTALFHVLARSDLIRDWKMDCLADRYVDLLNELSMWRELPHFFFNNASRLKDVFPQDSWWCDEIGSKNLMDELHPSLRLQLFERFSQIVQSFTSFKDEIDRKCSTSRTDGGETSSERADYKTIQYVLMGRSPEEVIHPPFTRARSRDSKGKKPLIDKQAEGSQVRKAAKVERKSGHRSNVDRNLRRPQESSNALKRQKKKKSRFVLPQFF